MTRKILKSILSVAIAVLMTSLLIITGVLYEYFGTVQERQLRDALELSAVATEQLGIEYLDALDSDRYRLTWVDADGTVLFDSRADATSMKNHSDREEIQEALASGSGSSTRRSATFTEETIYEAVRLHDGSVLRISVSRATALTLVLGMVSPIAIIFLLAVVLSICLAKGMAKRVVEPLNTLDLDNPIENDAYEELSPLLHRIHAQHLEINRQMRTLQQKQEEFHQITGNMKEALVLLDDRGRILSINPAARTLFQVEDSCVGDDFLTVNRKQNMRNGMAEAKDRGSAVFRDKLNGRDYQFDLSTIDSDGTYHGMVILAFDITEQVNAEKHRQEFTANVSHELKTPLQSIIGSAELLENRIVKDEDVPRFVGRIRREATRLVTLIDDIIRLSQLDEGEDMPREAVSLRALSEEVCQTLSDTAKRNDISMEVTGDDGVIIGVRRLLYEVVYNLCDNAIKYNHPGGSVQVTVSQKSGEVLLRVRDTGIGIPPEYRDKVFERFFRVDKSHSKASGGTGLGLSIVKHAVEYHHGKITVDSAVNRGTTISVLFDRG